LARAFAVLDSDILESRRVADIGRYNCGKSFEFATRKPTHA